MRLLFHLCEKTDRTIVYAAAVLSAGREALCYLPKGDVVMDRYWSSTRAYAYHSSLHLAEVEHILPKADLTLVITLDEQERWRRLRQRGASDLDLQAQGEAARHIGEILRMQGAWSGGVYPVPVDGLDEVAALAAALAIILPHPLPNPKANLAR